MAWARQGRNLPANWQAIRRHILDRDQHRCTWTQADGTRCRETTRLEVDHIGDPGNHTPANLRTLCHWHHKNRTALQAAAAKQRRAAVRRRGLRRDRQLRARRAPGLPGPAGPAAREMHRHRPAR